MTIGKRYQLLGLLVAVVFAIWAFLSVLTIGGPS